MNKKHFLPIFSIAAIVACLTTTSCGSGGSKSDPNKMQRDLNFNDNWQFMLEDSDEEKRDISLPHDFSIEQPFNFTNENVEAESGFMLGGIGHYYKEFTLPNVTDSSIVLNFDGAYSRAKVIINDHVLGTNKYGYNNFAFDISKYVKTDNSTLNKLEVIVENPLQASRWYSGSGLYRDVSLSITDKVHIAYNGTYVTTPKIRSGNGAVNIDVNVDNDYDTDVSNVTVKNTIYDQEGHVVSSTSSETKKIPSKSSASYSSTLEVDNPSLWDVTSPNLYNVKTEVYRNNTLIDTYTTRFGFRSISFGENGLILNNRPIKMFGVCLHHDQGALGSAAYTDAIRRQLIKMKDMGMNAVRTSHNAPDRDLVRLCDELGLLVVDEAFDGWYKNKGYNPNDVSSIWDKKVEENNGDFIDADSNTLWQEYIVKNLVKRDRNSPSVILWSIGNEINLDDDKKDYNIENATNLINWVYEIDYSKKTQRKITNGDDNRTELGDYTYGKGQVSNTIYKNKGIVGYNYGSEEQLRKGLEEYDYLYSSESSSAINSRGCYSQHEYNVPIWYGEDYQEPIHDGAYHLMSYDNERVPWGHTAHQALYRVLAHDKFAGQFVWTGFDYIGEPTPWNSDQPGRRDFYLDDEKEDHKLRHAYPNSSYFGIVDTAGFNKDTYYLYRAQQNRDDYTLHLAGSFNKNNMYVIDEKTTIPQYEGCGGMTPFSLYSNAPIVRVYDRSNDQLLLEAKRKINFGDKETSPYYYFTYSISYYNSSLVHPIGDFRSDEPGFNLYTSFAVKPDNMYEYAQGIYAIGFDYDGETVLDTVGQNLVTPYVDTSHPIYDVKVTTRLGEWSGYSKVNDAEVSADGSSLIYVEVSLNNRNYDALSPIVETKPELCHEVNFSLTGNASIVGVDNGNQATIDKFQQKQVLINDKTAKIKFYAGKALVILKTTKEAGTIKLGIGGPASASITINSK